MIGYISSCLKGSVNLVKGLIITFKYMLKPVVTIQYPYEKKVVSERYRGILGLTTKAEQDMKDQEAGVENDHLLCISCFKCMDACPVECIDIQREKGDKGKFALKGFSINFARCTFCGLCVDACPVAGKAIVHTRHYEEVFFERKEMVFDLRKLDLVGQGLRPHEQLGDQQVEILRRVRGNPRSFNFTQEERESLETIIVNSHLARLNPEQFDLINKIASADPQGTSISFGDQDVLRILLDENSQRFELSTFGVDK
jgi:NADH-quinone oxidoreductase subunit I